MTAPAGPCEQCGGPQWWTIVGDEMYVKCQAGCLWLDLEGEVLSPRISEGGLVPISEVLRGMEQLGVRGVVPHEGGDANPSDKHLDELPF